MPNGKSGTENKITKTKTSTDGFNSKLSQVENMICELKDQ